MDCPVCGETIRMPVRLDRQDGGCAVMVLDSAPYLGHIKAHEDSE